MISNQAKSKSLVLFQLLFVLMWLMKLRGTDAYYYVYGLLAFGGVVCIIDNYQHPQPIQKPIAIRTAVLSALFSLSTLAANHFLFEPAATLTSLFGLTCGFIGGFFLYFGMLSCMLRRLPLPLSGNASGQLSNPKFFGLCFFSIVCIDLVFLFFVEFPGVLTADSFNQMEQVVSGSFSNRNPYWHTKTIGLFVNLGTRLTGDIHGGIALYSLAQILLLASVFSYSLVTLYRKGIPSRVLLLCWAAYALFPYNIAYSVTMWKDIPFSAASLLLITALYRILYPVNGGKKKDFVLFLLGSLGLCLWRTNGLLVYIMLLPFLASRKRKAFTAAMVVVLVLCMFLTGPFLSARNIQGSDYVETISLPLQQVSRVICDEKYLPEEDLALIRSVADPETIQNTYDSMLSDPIKVMVRKSPAFDTIRENPMPYLSLWLRTGMRYPGVYFKAWVDQTKGYWSAGYNYWYYATGMAENDLGVETKTAGTPVAKLFHGIARYFWMIEFTQPILSIGLYTMLIVFCCFLNRVNRRQEWLLTVPSLAILLGLLIGTPVYAEFRYAYPVMLACPFVLPLTLFRMEENK